MGGALGGFIIGIQGQLKVLSRRIIHPRRAWFKASMPVTFGQSAIV